MWMPLAFSGPSSCKIKNQVRMPERKTWQPEGILLKLISGKNLKRMFCQLHGLVIRAEERRKEIRRRSRLRLFQNRSTFFFMILTSETRDKHKNGNLCNKILVRWRLLFSDASNGILTTFRHCLIGPLRNEPNFWEPLGFWREKVKRWKVYDMIRRAAKNDSVETPIIIVIINLVRISFFFFFQSFNEFQRPRFKMWATASP